MMFVLAGQYLRTGKLFDWRRRTQPYEYALVLASCKFCRREAERSTFNLITHSVVFPVSNEFQYWSENRL